MLYGCEQFKLALFACPSDGVLLVSSPSAAPERFDLACLTTKELQEKGKAMKLQVAGRKQDVISQILSKKAKRAEPPAVNPNQTAKVILPRERCSVHCALLPQDVLKLLDDQDLHGSGDEDCEELKSPAQKSSSSSQLQKLLPPAQHKRYSVHCARVIVSLDAAE